MNILTKWLRSYLPALPVDDAQLAEDLTLRGIAVEGIFPAEGGGSRFEMDITTNRVDAMNHYGVAREAAAELLHRGTALGMTGPRTRVAVPTSHSTFTHPHTLYAVAYRAGPYPPVAPPPPFLHPFPPFPG